MKEYQMGIRPIIFLFLIFIQYQVHSQLEKIKTDNLPAYSGFLGDLVNKGFTANVFDVGFFGDKDIVVDVYNVSNQSALNSFYVGTTGREGFAHACSSNSSIYVTGQSNLGNGDFDDVFVARVDVDNSENSWVKVLQGGLSDKGKRIYIDGEELVILANSNSFQSDLSLHFIRLNFDGDILSDTEVVFQTGFYPTDFVSDQTHFFISGYTFNGAIIEGKILKMNKTSLTVDWCKSIESINSLEINQLIKVGDDLSFLGWVDNGNSRELMYGLLDVNGDLIWHRSVDHLGNYSATSSLYSNDKIISNGFIKLSNSNEEDHLITIINLLTKEVEMYSISDLNRLYGTSDVLLNNDLVYISSFQSDQLVGLSKYRYFDSSDNDCFENYATNGSSNTIQDVTISDFSVTLSPNELTLVETGGVESSSNSFFDFEVCGSDKFIISVEENRCKKINFNHSLKQFEYPCELKIIEGKVFNQLGKLLYETKSNEFNFDFEYNHLYFFQLSYLSENNSITTTSFKYMRE